MWNGIHNVEASNIISGSNPAEIDKLLVRELGYILYPIYWYWIFWKGLVFVVGSVELLEGWNFQRWFLGPPNLSGKEAERHARYFFVG